MMVLKIVLMIIVVYLKLLEFLLVALKEKLIETAILDWHKTPNIFS